MQLDWQLFRFPLDDDQWQSKAFTGGLLAFFGMFFFPLLWPVYGYGLRVMRRTIEDGTPSLPEWDDWGDLFVGGLKYWVVSLVYTLPMLLPMLCIFALMFMLFPALIVTEAEELMGAGTMLFVVSIMCSSVLSIPLSLFFSFLTHVAITRMVADDALASAFEFREVWRLAREGLNNYIVAYLMLFVTSIVISAAASLLVATIVLACLYPILLALTAVYIPVVAGSLFGTAYYLTEVAPSPAE